MSEDILIVDDEADIRNLIQGILEDEGYTIRQASNSAQAYEALEKSAPMLIVLDIWLQGSDHDGLEILDSVKNSHPDIPVIMISGHGTIETAVSSIKKGAYDFIEKPFKSDRLILMVQRALETAQLRRENAMLRGRSEERASELVGNSPQMQDLREILERVAQTNSRVLITGEAGAGKDIAARFIHARSTRADKPFMVLNCAVLMPERLEVELFGSETEGSVGVLEQADGGTLFLDEVSDMPLETQGKIVRVIQEQRFQKVGGKDKIEVDVRILASSNRNLEKAIEESKFREDLFYRLNVVPVNIPPLREHKKDVEALIEYFSTKLSRQSGLVKHAFSPAAFKMLQAYAWPGNVRQLRNVVEWVLIMKANSDSEGVDVSDLPPEITGASSASGASDIGYNADIMELSLKDAREIFEREYLKSQVERFDGNVSRTAEFVGMERSALHRKLKSLEILGAPKEAEPPDQKRAQG